jgi:hypothetical protein
MTRMNYEKRNLMDKVWKYDREPQPFSNKYKAVLYKPKKQRTKRNLPPLPEDKIDFSAFYLYESTLKTLMP